MKKSQLLLQITLTISIVTAVICFSITISLNARMIYESDIERYDLDKMSGLSKSEILEDYDTLIRYNNIGGPGELEFRHFRMSQDGRTHFREVRTIFLMFEYGLILSTVTTISLYLLARKNKIRLTYLKASGCVLTLMPAVLGTFSAIFWERAFVLFHKVAFDNDKWIFDETEDPIIKVLPDEFFFHEAVLILSIVFISGMLLLSLHRIKEKRSSGNAGKIKCHC